MAALPESPDAKAKRLLGILEPHLLRLLKDAPAFGSVTISAFLRDDDIGRIELGASVSRNIAPRADRGQS
jgi:hypothetical protein